MPARQEAAERGLLDRLDLAPQRRERGAAQPAQHVGVAPLALAAAGPQLAAHELLLALEPGAGRGSTSRPKRSFASAVVNGPRPRAKRSDELPQRLGAALEEDVRAGPPGGITPSASR